MPSLRSRTRLCPCADVALGAEPWLVTSLEPPDLAQASQGHWRQEPWDRVWEGLPGAELLCEDPWGPQARVFPESCRVFLRVMVMGRGPGGWTESALPLLSPSSDSPSLPGPSSGPGFLESISDLWSLSPQCVPCAECSNPDTGHNVEGMEAPSGSVRTEFTPPQHREVKEEALTEYMEVSSLSFCP